MITQARKIAVESPPLGVRVIMLPSEILWIGSYFAPLEVVDDWDVYSVIIICQSDLSQSTRVNLEWRLLKFNGQIEIS
jgi:hypothetical protein